jgi:hypothetical protein
MLFFHAAHHPLKTQERSKAATTAPSLPEAPATSRRRERIHGQDLQA